LSFSDSYLSCELLQQSLL